MPQSGSRGYQDPVNPYDSITEIKPVGRRTLAARKSENLLPSSFWDDNSFPTLREAQSIATNRDAWSSMRCRLKRFLASAGI